MAPSIEELISWRTNDKAAEYAAQCAGSDGLAYWVLDVDDVPNGIPGYINAFSDPEGDSATLLVCVYFLRYFCVDSPLFVKCGHRTDRLFYRWSGIHTLSFREFSYWIFRMKSVLEK